MSAPILNIDAVETTRELRHGDRYVADAESLDYWHGE